MPKKNDLTSVCGLIICKQGKRKLVIKYYRGAIQYWNFDGLRLISTILLRWIQKSLNKNAKAFSKMVPEDGLEPSLLSETDFESVASTNFTTRAECKDYTYAFITHKSFHSQTL